MSNTTPGIVTGPPRIWLGLEGFVVFCSALFLYHRISGSWILLAILFLTPDISFLGYLLGPRVGAVCYNLLHTYVFPLAWVTLAAAADQSLAIPVIWVAHIGFDRLMGYGLKYATAFGHTHLGSVGKSANPPERV